MKKNKPKNHQKRLETKRSTRNKRKNRKKNEPGIEWITDTMFSIHCDDKRIRNLFPSITVEIVDENYEFPRDFAGEFSGENDQTMEDHIQQEIYEINKIYNDIQNKKKMN
ncbi:MAG: hypothetical protein JXJ04_15145 [Spirochaetales bacterium]|nr:hypothetical protein [Spirochaetales bacterium]